MAEEGRFTYEPLPEDGDSIRLLKVLPGLGPHDLLQCELIHSTTKSEYTALSYTWGPLVNGPEVQIDNKLLAIRHNLWAFLKRISVSPNYQHTLFWIDALCINQEDDHEKSYQVARMGSIYESAHHVLIWLSPSNVHGEFLSKTKVPPINDFKATIQSMFARGRIQLAPESHSFATCSTFIRDRYFVESVISHDYWTRLWIVQEFLLNKERTVLYGSLAIPWEFLIASQTHRKADVYARRAFWMQGSVLDWLRSPIKSVEFLLCGWRIVTDYIHYEQRQFAMENAFSLAGSNMATISASSLSVRIMRCIGTYAPKTLARIVAWRTDIIQPALPSMVDMLESRIRSSSDPHLSTKSDFFLLLQNLAETLRYDRRDKLYGLAALLNQDHTVPIDYSIDVHQLYFRTLRFFLQPGMLSKEPCAMAPELVACELLNVFKILLSDLARRDAKKRCTNYAFLPALSNDTGESTIALTSSPDEQPVATYATISDVFQTFEHCIQLRIVEGESVLIVCPRCNSSTSFNTTTLLKVREYQILSDRPFAEKVRDDLAAVMQCHVSRPGDDSTSQQRALLADEQPSSNHLLLYIDPQSGRPEALLDVNDEIRRETLLRSLEPEVLRIHLEFIGKLSEGRPPMYTFPGWTGLGV